MTFFKHALSHFSHESTPVVATNMSLDSWFHQLRTHPTRFVQRVEMCTALSIGQDAWGTPVDETHHHTFLWVLLVPTLGSPDVSEDTLLIERVLSTGGSYHCVTPIKETFSTGGTLFHSDVHDRIAIISDGPSTALARDLEVEHTLAFGDGSSRPCLTLAQFAQILDFVSRMTMLIYAGGDCRPQPRSFTLTCLATLTSRLPPPTSVRRAGGGEVADDSVYELGVQAF